MVVMPFAHDQFDNAARVTRLGVGRTLQREDYRAERIAAVLRDLLSDDRVAVQAEKISRQIAGESGTPATCGLLERELFHGGTT
mgnify:CR=1 FL=1